MTLTSRYETLNAATDSKIMRERIARILSETTGVSSSAIELDVPRVMPRKSGEVLIQYALHHADENGAAHRQILYGEWGNGEDTLPPVDSADAGGVAFFNDLGLRLWKFPHDPKLRHLQALIDPQEFVKAYENSLTSAGITPPGGEQQTEILGYRLGRRLVTRITWKEKSMPAGAASTQIVAKMCRPKQALALWTRHRQLEHECLAQKNSREVFLPRQLLIEKQTGVVFQTAEQGPSLHDLIHEPSFIDGSRQAISTLKALQGLRMTGLSRFHVNDEIGHLDWLSERTGDMFPYLASELTALVDALKRTVPEEPIRTVVCHRDFYDKQVLYDGTQVVLIDYDTLAESDAALDIGNYLAHLEWRAYQEPTASAHLNAAASAVWETSQCEDSDMVDRVHWWTATSRARLACIYLWRPRWHERAKEYLERQLHGTRQGIGAHDV